MIGEGKYLIRENFGLEPNYKIGALPSVEKYLRKKFLDLPNYDIVDFCIEYFLYKKVEDDCDINNYDELCLEIVTEICVKALDR